MRYLFREVGTPPTPKWCDTPPYYLGSQRHICAIPHFEIYRARIVRYHIKTSTKDICDTIATSIARYDLSIAAGPLRCLWEIFDSWTRLQSIPKVWGRFVAYFLRKEKRPFKREPKPEFLGPDILGWGGGLPRERVGAKKCGMSLETREIKLFGQDFPGFCWDIPEDPKNFR